MPALVASIGGPDKFSSDMDVLITNLLFTLLVIFLFALTSELFNSTIDENRDDIASLLGRITRRIRFLLIPFAAVALMASRRTSRSSGMARMMRLGLVLVMTALIYGFLSEDFALDESGILLLISLFVGLAVVTYLSEGLSAQYSSNRLNATSSVQLFGPAIGLALACVVFSRVLDFEPGIIYGFVASAVVIAPVALSRRQEAEAVIIPAFILLAVSIACWFLLAPLRAAADADGSWPFVLADSVAAMVYIAGLEGLFFALIPLTFLDGSVIFKWSRLAWALMFGTVTFLFFQLVINQDDGYLEAFSNSKVVLALVLGGIWLLITVGTWAIFRYRSGHMREESAA